MKPLPSLAIALGAMLSLAACGDILFNADFEADTAGLRPSSSPAGPPMGDTIRVWIADPGNLVVVNPGINGNSLLYRYNPTLSQANFIGIETGRDAPIYWAAWNGRAERFSGSTPRLAFSVGNFNSGIANLEIIDGEFVASGDMLGDVVMGEEHTVIIRVDNRAGTYTVSVFQRRGGILSSGTKSLSSRGLIPGDRVFDISMFYDAEPSVSDPATYMIDDILITEKPPAMP